MKREYEISLNQYGQGLISIEKIQSIFNTFSKNDKLCFLKGLINLIQQSKVQDSDIEPAIVHGDLKPSYTACVMIKKGGSKTYNLLKLLDLPEYEMGRSLILLLNLFQIAYLRRFLIEKNNPDKWWYWDLSDPQTVEKILQSTD